MDPTVKSMLSLRRLVRRSKKASAQNTNVGTQEFADNEPLTPQPNHTAITEFADRQINTTKPESAGYKTSSTRNHVPGTGQFPELNIPPQTNERLVMRRLLRKSRSAIKRKALVNAGEEKTEHEERKSTHVACGNDDKAGKALENTREKVVASAALNTIDKPIKQATVSGVLKEYVDPETQMKKRLRKLISHARSGKRRKANNFQTLSSQTSPPYPLPSTIQTPTTHSPKQDSSEAKGIENQAETHCSGHQGTTDSLTQENPDREHCVESASTITTPKEVGGATANQQSALRDIPSSRNEVDTQANPEETSSHPGSPINASNDPIIIEIEEHEMDVPGVDGNDETSSPIRRMDHKKTEQCDRIERETSETTENVLGNDLPTGRTPLADIPVPRKRALEFNTARNNKGGESSLGTEKNSTEHARVSNTNAYVGRQAKFNQELAAHVQEMVQKQKCDAPSLLNQHALSVEPIARAMISSGYVSLQQCFQLSLLEHINGGKTTGTNYFCGANAHIEQRRLSFLYEMSADIIAKTAEFNYKKIPYRTRCRTKAEEGFFYGTLSEDLSQTRHISPYDFNCLSPQSFDLLLDISNNGTAIVAVSLDFGETLSKDGMPFLVLGWYHLQDKIQGIYRLGNLRNDFMTLNAIDFAERGNSGLQRILSAVMKNNLSTKHQLVTEFRNSDIDVAKAHTFNETSRCFDTATKYIEDISSKGIVNNEQASVLHKVLEICLLWESKPNFKIADLHRVFVVSGVPGCGKTHTAVYMISTLLAFFNKTFLLQQNVPSWNGQILVLTKTNKALDVFMDRIGSVNIPDTDNGKWEARSIPFFCRRSSSYLRRRDFEVRRHVGQSQDSYSLKELPLTLSTFGNTMNLHRSYVQCMGGVEAFLEWVKRYLRVLIVDEGSQSGVLELVKFLYFFRTFDGIVIILGDPKQMGPVVLTNIEEARRFLTSHLFSEFGFAIENKAINVSRLTQQYRMHKDIMSFANDIVYEGVMRYGCDPRKHESFRIPFVLGPKKLPFHPVSIYTTSYAAPSMFAFHEFTNMDEIRVAESLIHLAVSSSQLQYSDFIFLSPYEEQCHVMFQRCREFKVMLQVNTIAAFQGNEAKLVILSLVRRRGSETGFLHREEILSVAITRAIHRLVIIGDLNYLEETVSLTNVWEKVTKALKRYSYPICHAMEVID